MLMESKRGVEERAIVLGLLSAVEKGGVTQRGLSRELGIAVGLVNAYFKRCINTGLVKVQQIPPRRYKYYLTPKGLAEKSHLLANYFVYSFDFFRRARAACEATLRDAAGAGHRRVALLGASELAEIAIVVAADAEIEIVAVIDASLAKSRFASIPVKPDLAALDGEADAVIVTSLTKSQETYDAAVAVYGAERVYVPEVLSSLLVQRHRVEGSTEGTER